MKIPEEWPTREMIEAGRNTPLAGMDDEGAPEDYKAVFLAMLAAAPTPPACKMCNGHGIIVGFVSGEEGYHSEPCPDCNTPPAQEAEPVICQIRAVKHGKPFGPWTTVSRGFHDAMSGKGYEGRILYTHHDSELRKKADILQDYWNKAQRDLAEQQDQISELRKAAAEAYQLCKRLGYDRIAENLRAALGKKS